MLDALFMLYSSKIEELEDSNAKPFYYVEFTWASEYSEPETVRIVRDVKIPIEVLVCDHAIEIKYSVDNDAIYEKIAKLVFYANLVVKVDMRDLKGNTYTCDLKIEHIIKGYTTKNNKTNGSVIFEVGKNYFNF